jgi:hypothetical protein
LPLRPEHFAPDRTYLRRGPNFPHLKESAPRSGFVEEGDYARLAANARELWLRSLLAAGYTFGFRKSELLGLTSPVGNYASPSGTGPSAWQLTNRFKVLLT